jgi:enoyl-CoA hydratase/carnithine racemase
VTGARDTIDRTVVLAGPLSQKSAPMPSELLSEHRGSALVLTLSDASSRNALSEAVISAGIEALNSAESDPEVRCVVLQGADGQFCAGGHLQGLIARRAAGPAAQTRMLELLHQWIEALRVFPKPVLAAVEGAAAGAGFSLALACDLIVAAEDARFILSHGRLGLSPDGGATWALGRALPRPLAQQIVWFAEPVSARQLHDHGLVHSVCDAGQALATALGLAERLALQAPNALASAKELLNRAEGAALRAQLDAERDHFVVNLFHANGGEGLQAFIAKRPPRFV